MSRKRVDETPALTKEALELLRTRELYKYFEPLTTPSDADNDEHDAEQLSPTPGSDDEDCGDRPLSTGDPVLGSLVLLAERLLAADRVIVVFADAFREYLVADSQQALSHFTGEQPSTDDAPHPGSWKKRCRNRNDLFSAFISPPATNEPRTVADDDLPINDKWRYEWPDIRRYTGVPIRTRAGSVIGVLCALYRQPERDGSVDETNYNQMFQKMTAAVMRYMEVVRGEREMKRGRKMEIALSRFIAGNFSPDKVALTAQPEGSIRVETSNQESERMDGERAEVSKERSRKELERWRGREARRQAAVGKDDESWAGSPATSSIADSSGAVSGRASVSDCPSYFDSRPSPKYRTPSRSPPRFPGHYGLPFKAPDRSPPLRIEHKANRERSPGSGFNPSFLSREPHKPCFLPNAEEVTSSSPLLQNKKNSTAGSEAASVNSLPVNVAAAHHALFMRASDLMRRAMDVDGIVFVNYDLEGLSDLDIPADGQMSPLNHTSSNNHMSELVRAARAQDSRSRSGILGISGGRIGTSRSSDHNPSIVSAVGVDASELSEDYLHTLCESWPRGCIFAYSRDPKHPVIGISVNPDDSSDSDGQPHEETDNLEVVNVLRRFLPGSKSVMFIPLYDFVGKVFAVGFAWRSSAVRVFRGDVEGGFMAAFCDSIMQEISRIHVVSANVAKGNFISTISHELRSPLHGILASCELFRESALSDYEKDLVGTITSCGRTLLDTVNNVLTFTKLNTKANARKDRKNSKGNNSNQQFLVDQLGKTVSEQPVMDIDLAELVEEVVEASYVGYRFDPTPEQQRRSKEDGSDIAAMSTKEHVYVTLEIDPGITQRRFAVPPGAFRRLVLNLCTNALKYTDHGWIRLRLSILEDKKVIFTVADSGRGISREFLKNSLFTPFMQEFPMHSGTGLGMSIVRQLVDELGGTIDVRSQVGVGTEVCVSLTLESTLPGKDAYTTTSDDVLWKANEILPGKTVSLVGLDYNPRSTVTREALRGLYSYLSAILTDTFGMSVEESSLDSLHTDCAIVQEGKELEDYLEELERTHKTPAVPLIELGGGRVGGIPSSTNAPRKEIHRNLVVYLSRPYCPRKMAAALLCAIQRTPVTAMPPPPIPQHPVITAPSQPSSNPSSDLPTVLIVEDNIINMRLLTTFFKKSGYPFEQAMNGLEALQAVERRPEGFDVILMDLQMPVMSGTDSTRSIRALETERGEGKCTIIALTALSGDEAKLEAYRAGVDVFLVKPVKMGELKGILRGRKWVR